MLTGTRPFDRGTPIATALSHVNEPPPPLDESVPAELRAVVAALLEKDPADRPAAEQPRAERASEQASEQASEPAVVDTPTVATRPEDLLD